MVDVTGIEPVTPCLQNSPLVFRNTFFLSYLEHSSKLSLPSRMCPDVRGCGRLIAGSLQKSLQSSPNETEARA
jgi:hypothetical protein